MQKKDTIQDKDNERDPLISYFRTLEKEVPEADIEKRWNALMQNVNREPVSKRHRYLRIYMLAAGVAALFAGIAWGTKIYMDHHSHSIDTAIALLEQCTTDTVQQVLLITHARNG